MRLTIDNTRFFAVVGAPYIPEHHLDAGGTERRAGRHNAFDVPAAPSPGSTECLNDRR